MQVRHQRGQPLVVLCFVLGGWALVRAAAWDVPAGMFRVASPAGRAEARVPGPALAGAPLIPAAPVHADALAHRPLVSPYAPPKVLPAPLTGSLPRADKTLSETAGRWDAPLPRPAAAIAPVPREAAVGHALLLLAGLSRMEVPPALLAVLRPGPKAAQGPAPARLTNGFRSRWSADGWIMLRQDRAGALAASRPSHGRSQAGAVLRYRLSDSALRPEAYLRGSAALSGPAEREAAAGLSVRAPLGMPVRLMAEMRAADRSGRVMTRPAAMAVTELPPARLPLDLRGEAYVQAGYVGGADATPFIDGQARVDHVVARSTDRFQLRAGGGAWGGAQHGAARLDLGPTAGLDFGVQQARGRLSVDYRFRVAGDALPDNGPAITLSAGF